MTTLVTGYNYGGFIIRVVRPGTAGDFLLGLDYSGRNILVQVEDRNDGTAHVKIEGGARANLIEGDLGEKRTPFWRQDGLLLEGTSLLVQNTRYPESHIEITPRKIERQR
jgi:hypothetical protein